MHSTCRSSSRSYDGTAESLYGIGGVATEQHRAATAPRRSATPCGARHRGPALGAQRAVDPDRADRRRRDRAALIGTIDDERGRNIMQALLDGVTEHRARAAILDVTGVRSVDGQVASGLLQSVRAARLLGTKVIVTGIRPEVAQAMVGLDADWSGVQIFATMRDAVAWALSREPRR
ncbi:STAS domain-containing protein [Nannocystis radixulma]|uniref:STAS domain-containing protein n=1 Tax=Nannocystis radixulma TaxID=2995305 RepID=A0ABT5BC16_9BACT|nr:STAS domain-containing protein [Nannocystis radixulma]MDC0671622.1 STAS domain-containing protein [Nannocystis radixulma]